MRSSWNTSRPRTEEHLRSPVSHNLAFCWFRLLLRRNDNVITEDGHQQCIGHREHDAQEDEYQNKEDGLWLP